MACGLTLLIVALRLLKPLSGGVRTAVSLATLAMWLPVVWFTTFAGPFTVTGNGFFAAWLGVACAAVDAMNAGLRLPCCGFAIDGGSTDAAPAEAPAEAQRRSLTEAHAAEFTSTWHAEDAAELGGVTDLPHVHVTEEIEGFDGFDGLGEGGAPAPAPPDGPPPRFYPAAE